MAIIKKTFPVKGLGCAACVARVENTLKAVEGVADCSVSLASNSASVEYDNATTSAEKLQKAIQDAGYDLVVEADADEGDDEAELVRQEEYRKLRRDMVWAIILALAIFVIQMGFKDFRGRGISLFLLASASVFWCGRRFHRSAFKQARHLSAGMDTLVSISTLISFIFSTFNLAFPTVLAAAGGKAPLYFDSAAMITAFILIGRVLEDKAKYGNTYHDDGYVCANEDGTVIHPQYLSRKFKKLLEKNDLPVIRLHDLRHSAATNLLAMGFSIKDVSVWLGHADITTTLNIYSHVLEESKVDMAEALWRGERTAS